MPVVKWWADSATTSQVAIQQTDLPTCTNVPKYFDTRESQLRGYFHSLYNTKYVIV